MNTLTIGTAEKTFGVTVLDYHDRSADIPVVIGLQHQGDVSVIPAHMVDDYDNPVDDVPQAGHPVVQGENGGNTHLLLASGQDVKFTFHEQWESPDSAQNLTLCSLRVPEGSVAYLAHPEHAYSGVGPGEYVIRRKRTQEEEIRFVAD